MKFREERENEEDKGQAEERRKTIGERRRKGRDTTCEKDEKRRGRNEDKRRRGERGIREAREEFADARK